MSLGVDVIASQNAADEVDAADKVIDVNASKAVDAADKVDVVEGLAAEVPSAAEVPRLALAAGAHAIHSM